MLLQNTPLGRTLVDDFPVQRWQAELGQIQLMASMLDHQQNSTVAALQAPENELHMLSHAGANLLKSPKRPNLIGQSCTYIALLLSTSLWRARQELNI